jgi:hypothetical protein
MGRFIYTDRGFVNLDRIERAIPKNDGRYEIVVDGKTVTARDTEFERKIVSIVAVAEGQWECLTRLLDDGDPPAILSEPILAWGLTALGDTVPITAVDTDGGAAGTFALRKIGDARVFVPGHGTYDNAEDWLAEGVKEKATV